MITYVTISYLRSKEFLTYFFYGDILHISIHLDVPGKVAALQKAQTETEINCGNKLNPSNLNCMQS